MIQQNPSGTPITADHVFTFAHRARCFHYDHKMGLHLFPADGAGGGGKKDDEGDKDAAFWKADALAAREERDRAKEQIRTLSDSQTALQKQLDDLAKREKARSDEESKRQEEANRSKLESEGKYREALEGEQKKWSDKVSALQSAATKRLLEAGITSAAAAIENLTPDARADLPYLLRDAVRVNPDTFELEVIADGKPLQEVKDGKLQPVSVTAYLQQFVAKKPYLLLDGMAKGSGSKPGGQEGKGSFTPAQAIADEKIREEWKKNDPEGYKKAFDEYNSPANVVKRAQEMVKGEQ